MTRTISRVAGAAAAAVNDADFRSAVHGRAPPFFPHTRSPVTPSAALPTAAPPAPSVPLARPPSARSAFPLRAAARRRHPTPLVRSPPAPSVRAPPPLVPPSPVLSRPADTTPLHLQLRAALPEWAAIGAPPWVLRAIRAGVPLPWASTPLPYRAEPYPLPPPWLTWAIQEAQRWCAAGFARRLSRQEAARAPWVSPAFVADRLRKPRLVLDLKYVNSFLHDKPFRYESLALFLSQLEADDYLVSWDVKDAFHHLALQPVDAQRLVFRLGNRYYEPLTLPFGLKLAPWAWTKLCRPILQHLRSLGFALIGYMDDFLCRPPCLSASSAAAATAGRASALALFSRLGLSVHPHKGSVEGTRRLAALGHLVDTSARRLLLPATRQAKVMQAAVALLAESASHRRWVGGRRLRRFCGLAMSTALAVPMARFRLRRLYHCIGSTPPSWDARLRVGARHDLAWWASLGAPGKVGRLLWQEVVRVELTTDACLSGWGAVMDRRLPARGLFGPGRAAEPINLKELVAVRMAIESFPAAVARGGLIRVRCDNMVVVAVLNAMVSRSTALMVELRRTVSLLSRLGCRLEASWLPTAENVWADKLSRDRDATDWRLNRSVFQSLDTAWGPCSIDRFATAGSAHLPRFNSPTAHPGAEAVDGWQQYWGGSECNFVCPPFSQAALVIRKIVRDRATAVVVLPAWPAQVWWAETLHRADAAVYLPTSSALYSRGPFTPPAPPPRWRTVALFYRAGGRPWLPRRGGVTPTPQPWTRLAASMAPRRPPRC